MNAGEPHSGKDRRTKMSRQPTKKNDIIGDRTAKTAPRQRQNNGISCVVNSQREPLKQQIHQRQQQQQQRQNPAKLTTITTR